MNVFAWIAASLVTWAVGVALTFGVMPATVTLLRRHGGRHAR